MKIKTVCALGILTALYVILSAFCRIPLIGNISLDLGYVAFGVALVYFGIAGTLVGTIGCALESILFTAYGFSISWFVANFFIGFMTGYIIQETTKHIAKWIFSGVLFTAIGMMFFKTYIEMKLYDIPLAVKLPKNAIAFVVDALMLTVGILIADKLKKARATE